MTHEIENPHNSSSTSSNDVGESSDSSAAPGKEISAAAKRALEEAAERRAAIEAKKADEKRPEEWNGPRGEEPTRYGDWGTKGYYI